MIEAQEDRLRLFGPRRAQDVEPKTVAEPPQPARVITFDMNDPNAMFSLPSTMRKGEHVVLKGEVKHLKLSGLDAGTILDASGLKAGEVTISGKIDGRSVLKLNVPNGLVTISGTVVIPTAYPGIEVQVRRVRA